MKERKFGETTLIGESWFEKITKDMEANGFEYQGVESLTTIKMGDDNKFKEISEQTIEDIKNKYSKFGEVEIVRDPSHENSVLVFLKTK